MLATPNGEALEALVSSGTWATYGELLMQQLKRATAGFAELVQPENCATCDPEALSLFAALEVIILVENPRSDGAFIREVAQRLRPRISPAFRVARVVKFLHGGGIGDIPQQLPLAASEHLRLRIAGLPPRFVVVVDSDAKSPGAPSIEARKVAEVAKREGVACHVLAKRSIENYIPDEALWAYAHERQDTLPVVGLITSLDGLARDHYPIKTGLPLNASASHEIESQYPPGLPREMGLSNFMLDLLSRYPHFLRRAELLSRDHGSDLHKLLDVVERNL